MLTINAAKTLEYLNDLYPDDTAFTYKDAEVSTSILASLCKQGYLEIAKYTSPIQYRNLHKKNDVKEVIPVKKKSKETHKTVINIPVGTVVGKNTNGTFVVEEILTQSETDRLWTDEFNKTPPHDCAYHIRLKCGKLYWTLKTQVWKCMSPNDVGWRKCYNCKKTCHDTCQFDQQLSHSVSVKPLRGTDFKPGTLINELKVIELAFNTKRHNYWEFECTKCGSHIFRMTPTNKSDIEQCHCPACTDIKYKGPRVIKQYLDTNNIPYQKEYKFSDCVYKNQLPFDFAIFYPTGELKCLIEYDGEQHYKFVKHWHGNEEGFKLQQLRDKIKNDYCKQHNIKLIRISYTEFDNINQILESNLII